MADEDGYDEPDCMATRETAKAILVLRKGALLDAVDAMDTDGPTEVWVPKSVIHDDSEVFAADDEGTLIVFEWWAEKQGWL